MRRCRSLTFAVEPGSFAQSDSEMFTYKGEV